MTRIAVLGGRPTQEALIAKIVQMGHDVIVVDSRPTARALNLSTIGVPLDAQNIEAVTEVLSAMKVDGVVTSASDYSIFAVSEIARRLNLRGQNPELARTCTNKFLMRSSLIELTPDLIPEFEVVDSVARGMEVFNRRQNKLIVKPVDSQGSRGVSRLTETLTAEKICSALRKSKEGLALIEDLIPGEEFSIDALVSGDELIPLAISAKEHYPGNPCLDRRCSFLFSDYANFETLLIESTSRIAGALGITNSLVHAEWMINRQGPFLMEIGLRTGGAGIGDIIIPYLSEFDPTTWIVKEALGEGHEMRPQRSYQDSSAILRFIDRGVKTSDLNINALSGRAEVLAYTFDHLSSTDVIPASSDGRAGYMIIGGTDARAALELERLALKKWVHS